MTRRYHALRMMADDLTGALDSAAAFVPVFGPLPVGRSWSAADDASSVLNSGTRDMEPSNAAARIRTLAAGFAPDAARLSFFKVDSLLRGHAGSELATLLKTQPFRHVIIAPALPFQRRITRGGRQHTEVNGTWQATGEDLAATLRNAGLAVEGVQPGRLPASGIMLCDAGTDSALAAIAQAGLACDGPVLWVGSAGLAGALAQELGDRPPPQPRPVGPVLGLIGSHHRVMMDQLEGVASHWLRAGADDAVTLHDIATRLGRSGAAFVTCLLPEGIDRETARAQIEATFTRLVGQLPPPGLFFASGGETLDAIALALGAGTLEVSGQIEPGAPVSRLFGGRWDGVTVLSKSGAFGAPDFLETLLFSLQDNRKVIQS